MIQDKHKILIVEDDHVLIAKISNFLRNEQFLCTEAQSASKAKRVIVKSRPDLVVLDLNLPDGDGLELLQELRLKDDLPVVVVSGRNADTDKVKGLLVGADDYLTKPFNPNELVLRIRTILKRSHSTQRSSRFDFGEIMVDTEKRTVTQGTKLVKLTSKEFDLLVFLTQNPNKVYSREELLGNVWHSSSKSSKATVTEHVRRLRLKIEQDPASPRHLCAVRSSGYQFVP